MTEKENKKEIEKKILTIDDLCKQYGFKKEEFRNEAPKFADITMPCDNYKKFAVRIGEV